MVLGRAAQDLSAERPLERLAPPEVRDWLLTLRATLSPVSVAGASLELARLTIAVRD
jgi:hypothetical protein